MKGWQMYSKIQSMKEQGFSIRQVSRHIRVSRNTIAKYWEMAPEEYATNYKTVNRLSALSAYEQIILNWLETYPNMTAAQVRDWLEERHQLDASERTVRRLAANLREKHGITKQSEPRREYEAVEELPKGQQLQLDLGEKTVRDANSLRYIKLYFAIFTLSHSRYKWGCFQVRPFNGTDMVTALYGCFHYMGGRPAELVYDQDSILVVSENHGDIIHTQTFAAFLRETKLAMRVCRKNDPQSKGKIEASVKFVKSNFMENRLYMGIDAWNQMFEDWLDRTGNGKTHGTTKRKPSEMFKEEQEHLIPVNGLEPIPTTNNCMKRNLRSDNTILYRSNRYSVPYGTYGKIKTLYIVVTGTKLTIMDGAGEDIAEHEIIKEKGKLIKPDAHRKKNKAVTEERLTKAAALLGEEFRGYLTEICMQKPRYVKEQLGLIISACEEHGREHMLTAMRYCIQRGLYNAGDLYDAANMLENQNPGPSPLQQPIKLPVEDERYHVNVQKRELSVYAQVASGGAAL